ncbi:hypothetical protein VPNG_06733 [Cytospora leucostoma]|uniref:Uncharacterized protein n=1 Tax=Cytospora leucostoma TaxID=1230097 RepID=A0A423WTN7_9PEZI|nr:hypothetical protein VPNG_06733 [Cytospora leucostoma]
METSFALTQKPEISLGLTGTAEAVRELLVIREHSGYGQLVHSYAWVALVDNEKHIPLLDRRSPGAMASTSNALPAQDATRMVFPPPKDMITECYQKVKDSARPKVFINYPDRVFHLKPQFRNLWHGRDWEAAFLWHKVSVPHMKAEFLDPFPLPGLDLPADAFPPDLHAQRDYLEACSPPDEKAILRWAKDVLTHVESEAEFRERTRPRYVRTHYSGYDLRADAIGALYSYAESGSEEAEWLLDELVQRERLREELQRWVRFRDHEGVPSGLGFRPARDTLYLDNMFLQDYLERMGGRPGHASVYKVPLVSFLMLDGRDRANISRLAVSVEPFLAPGEAGNNLTVLCHGIARSFPNVTHLRLVVSTGVIDRPRSHAWDLETRHVAGFHNLDVLAAAEIQANGGSSYLPPPPAAADDDPDHWWLGGERTMIVRYGLEKGLILDPARRHRRHHASGAQPPLVGAVVVEMAWQRYAALVEKKARRGVARRAAASKLSGTPTRLPRPAPDPFWDTLARPRRYSGAGDGSPVRGMSRAEFAARLTRREFEQRRDERLGGRDRDLYTSPSLSSIELYDIIPQQDWQVTVEPVVVVYYRDSFDRAVACGWRDIGHCVDMDKVEWISHVKAAYD